MKDVILCAIESSCDETAVAIIKNGNEVLSNIVSSQIDIHQRFKGVMPEIASRLHVEQISIVIKEAIEKADITWEMVDGIAFTLGPGLVGSLHTGALAAKTIAWYFNKPLIPVHHIVGHIYANAFVETLSFPLLALVVSGGHTELVLMKEHFDFEVLGSTLDDAVGESYDKVGRMLDLPYPGGPVIDRLAKLGKEHYKLPHVKTENPLDFSFSGLKSAVYNLLKKEERKGNKVDVNDMAYAFQEAALDQLIEKTRFAIDTLDVKHIILAGGVAANSRLRERLTQLVEIYPNKQLTIPPMWCCTDNAAMIGAAGMIAFQKGKFSLLSVGVKANLKMLEI
jgi:N6-L-threonylcarbamoyladenine synthase